MDDINKLRNMIDLIDKEIMDLLNNRYDLSLEIGELKSANSSKILDTERELIILDKASKYSHFTQIKAVYNTIMNESKSIQNME